MSLVSSAEQVAPDVVRVRHVFVNAVLVGQPDGVVLVDAALPGADGPIRAALAERFQGAPIIAIVLTHGHFDHVGGLKGVLKRFDVPVWASDAEAPYLTGRAVYPRPEPKAGGGAMAWMSFAYPRKSFDPGPRLKALPRDGDAPSMTGWRVVPTPGHTPGHVSLFRERDRLLIAGDAFCTTRQESLGSVVMQKAEVSGPPAYFTPDWESARGSVETLAALDPAAAVTGHGPAMRGEALKRGLTDLAARFGERAVPRHGRYAPGAR